MVNVFGNNAEHIWPEWLTYLARKVNLFREDEKKGNLRWQICE